MLKIKLFKKIPYVLLCLSFVGLLSVQVYSESQTVSGTIASAIITQARYYLNEPTAVLWADDELLVWLNEGMVDIAARTQCLVGTERIDLVANQYNYSLNSTNINYKALDIVYLEPSGSDFSWKGLKKGNPRSVGHVSASGVPSYWYESGSVIAIYPTLSAITTNKVDIYFAKRPATVASGAALTIPAQYDNALIKYVAARAWYKDGQFAKGGRLMAEYLEQLDRFRVDYAEQPITSSDAIK